MLVEATVFTNSLTTLALEYELDALNLLMAPSASVNCATHIGTRIDAVQHIVCPWSMKHGHLLRFIEPIGGGRGQQTFRPIDEDTEGVGGQ